MNPFSILLVFLFLSLSLAVSNTVPYLGHLVPLGLESGAIPDSAITASSTHPSCNVADVRLNTVKRAGAWCALSAVPGDFVTIDLGTTKTVSGIGIQGRSADSEAYPQNSISYADSSATVTIMQWVTGFAVSYSSDGVTFSQTIRGQNLEVVFDGNTDWTSVVVNKLTPVVTARFVRIHVRGFSSHPSMRLELYTGGVIISAPPKVSVNPKDRKGVLRGVAVLDNKCGHYRVTVASNNGAQFTLATTAGLSMVADTPTSKTFTGSAASIAAAVQTISLTSTGPAGKLSFTTSLHNGGDGPGFRTQYYQDQHALCCADMEGPWNRDTSTFYDFRGTEFTPVFTKCIVTWSVTVCKPIPQLSYMEDYSARVFSRISPSVTGTYVFIFYCDDGHRMWLDGTLLFSYWAGTGPSRRVTGPINLNAGQTYVFTFEWQQHRGPSGCQMYWERTSAPVMGETVLRGFACSPVDDFTSVDIDNPPPPSAVALVTASVTATEGAGNVLIPVKLTADPGRVLILSVYNPNPAQATVSTKALYFNPANWFLNQFITVSAVDNAVAETSPIAVPLELTCGTGSGSSGVLTVSTTVVLNTYTALTAASTPAGSMTIAVQDATGLVADTEIFIWQAQHPTLHGSYEFNMIASCAPATGPSTCTLRMPLAFGYESAAWDVAFPAARAAQVVRVPHYESLRITATGVITATPWNGKTGGFVILRVQNTFTFDMGARVDVTGTGYRGGHCRSYAPSGIYTYAGSPQWPLLTECGNSQPGTQGESYLGIGKYVMYANGNGGGGGFGPSGRGGEPAAGGGHRFWGDNAYSGANPTLPQGGRGIGDAALSRIYFGGGGGAGGDNDDVFPFPNGGAGGGAALLFARSFAGPVTVLARGANGILPTTTNPPAGRDSYCLECRGTSGAGGGGVAWISSRVALSGSPSLDVEGGIGGKEPVSDYDLSGDGGAGWTLIDSVCSIFDDSATATVNVVDNDVAGIVLNADASTLWVNEVASTATNKDTYALRLNSEPAVPSISVAVTGVVATELTITPSTLTFTPGNWNAFQTVTITGNNDAVTEPAMQIVTLTHTPASADPFYNGATGFPLVLATARVYAQPVVSSITPSSVVTNPASVLVVIKGANFFPTEAPGARTVTIGGTTCALPSFNDPAGNEVVCVVPAGMGVNRQVIVTVNEWASASPVFLSYLPPKITAIAPAKGSTTGGYPITLYGSNFGPDTTTLNFVRIGGTDCAVPVFAVPHHEIRCTVPQGVNVARAVKVQAGGQLDVSSVEFSYNPPVVSSIVPSAGPSRAGAFVTLNGANFGFAGLTRKVNIVSPFGGKFNGECVGPVWDDVGHTRVVCAMIAGIGPTRAVSLLVDTLTSNSLNYKTNAPDITAIVPPTVKAEGGTDVTLVGVNFGELAWEVTPSGSLLHVLSGALAGFTSCLPLTRFGPPDDDSMILCRTPAGAPDVSPIALATVAGQTGTGIKLTYFTNWVAHNNPADIAIFGRPLDVAAFGLVPTKTYRCQFVNAAIPPVTLFSPPVTPASRTVLNCLCPDWPFLEDDFLVSVVEDVPLYPVQAFTGYGSRTHRFLEAWLKFNPASGVAGLPTVFTFVAGGLGAGLDYFCKFEIPATETFDSTVVMAAVDSKTVSCTVPERSFLYGGRKATVTLFRVIPFSAPKLIPFKGFPLDDLFEFLIVPPLAPPPPTYPVDEIQAFQVGPHWLMATVALSGGAPVLRYHLYNENGDEVYVGTNLTTTVYDMFPDTLTSFTIAYENEAGIGPRSLPGPVKTLPSGPILHAVSPPEGITAGGQVVNITGIQFSGPFTQLLTVTIGGNMCNITASAATWITCITPPNQSPGDAPIVVTTRVNGVVISSNDLPPTLAVVLENNELTFVYVPPPEVRQSDPEWAPIFSNRWITLTGEYLGRQLSDVALSALANVTCNSLKYTSPERIECETGIAGAPTEGATLVRTVSGGNSVVNAFFAFQRPLISGVAPAKIAATGGTEVTLRGKYIGLSFSDIVSARVGKYLCDPATFVWTEISSDERTLSCTFTEAINDFIGHLPTFVKTKSGGESPEGPLVEIFRPGFSVLPPWVTAAVPPSSPLVGGINVTFYGSALGASETDLQGISAAEIACVSFGWISDKEITCVTGSSPVPVRGVVIPRTRSGGAGGSSITFPFQPPKPVIEDINPRVVDKAGGTEVTLFGTKFGDVLRDQTAYLDGVPCLTTKWIAANETICVVPSELALPVGGKREFTIQAFGVLSDPYQSDFTFGVECRPRCGRNGDCIQPPPGCDPCPAPYCSCRRWWAIPPDCETPAIETLTPIGKVTEDSPDVPTIMPVACRRAPVGGNAELTATWTDATEGSIENKVLVFTPDNWRDMQTLTLLGRLDDLRDGNMPVPITYAVSAPADPGLDQLPMPATTVVSYESSPIIDAVYPEVIPLNGTIVTIVGRNFDPVLDVALDDLSSVTSVPGLASAPTRYLFKAFEEEKGATLVTRANFTGEGVILPEGEVGRRRAQEGMMGMMGQGEFSEEHVQNDNNGETSVVDEHTDLAQALRSWKAHAASKGYPDDVVAAIVRLPPLETGYKDIWVLNRRSPTKGTLPMAVFYTADCPEPGTFGKGIDCKPCPEGATCPGGNRVVPNEGYWSPDEASGVVKKCAPPSACKGGRSAECAEGYEGTLCADCVAGWFRATGNECLHCPSSQMLGLFLLIDVLVWLLLALAGATLVKYSNLGKVVTMIMSLQQVGAIGEMLEDRAPRAIREIYNFLRLFSGNYNFVKPECFHAPDGYDQQFFLQLFYSLCVGIPIVGAVPIARWISTRYHASHGPEVVAERHRFYSMRTRRMTVIWFSVIYYPVTRECMRALSCFSLAGKPVLLSSPSTECFSRGHKLVAFVAVTLVIFFVLGFPAAMTRRFVRNYENMFDDIKFREAFNSLYDSYKPRYWWLLYLDFLILIMLAAGDAITRDPLKRVISVGAIYGFQLLVAIILRPYGRATEGFLAGLFTIANFFAVLTLYYLSLPDASPRIKDLLVNILVGVVLLCLVISVLVVVYFIFGRWKRYNSVYGHDYFISKAIKRSMKMDSATLKSLIGAEGEGDGDDDEDGDGGDGVGVGSGGRAAGAAAGAALGGKSSNKKNKNKSPADGSDDDDDDDDDDDGSDDANAGKGKVKGAVRNMGAVPEPPVKDLISDLLGIESALSVKANTRAMNMAKGLEPADYTRKFAMGSSSSVPADGVVVTAATLPAFALPKLEAPIASRYATPMIDSSSEGSEDAQAEVRLMVDANQNGILDFGFGVLYDDPALVHRMYGEGLHQLTETYVEKEVIRTPLMDAEELSRRVIDVESVTGDPEPTKVFEISSVYLNRRLQQCLFRALLGLKYVKFLPKYLGADPSELATDVLPGLPMEPYIKRYILPWGQQHFHGTMSLAEMVDGMVMEAANFVRTKICQSLRVYGFGVVSEVSVENIDFTHKRTLIVTFNVTSDTPPSFEKPDLVVIDVDDPLDSDSDGGGAQDDGGKTKPKVPAVPAPFVSLVQRMIHRSLGDDLGCAPYKCKPTATSCCATTWGACISGCRSDCLQNSAGLFCCTNIYPYGERCATDCPKC